MGNKQFDPTTYRLEYIPQRLMSLEACVIACHTVLSSQVDNPLDLDLGSSKLSLPDLSILVGIAIDAGLVANRTLLNFVGIKLDNGTLVNETYGLTIEEFSLPLVPINDACRVLEPAVPSTQMLQIWVEALKTASKSVAHFTEAGATISVARLGFACMATAELIRRQFFTATSTPGPDSIITPEVKPSFGGVWNAADPLVNIQC
jgi:hypothetical protein